MRKILIFTVMAAFAIAGCKEDNKEPEQPKPPEPPIDVYETFKADVTPRWESGSTSVKNEDSDYIFIVDSDETLFESAKYKIGYMTEDGDNYEIIEFGGTAAVGKPSEPVIRKPSGNSALHSLEIVKVESGKLWIVFKETATSAERRIVQ